MIRQMAVKSSSLRDIDRSPSAGAGGAQQSVGNATLAILLASEAFDAGSAAATSDKPIFDKPGAQQRSCAMEATDLQNRLAHLAPGETLLLPATEIEQAFFYKRIPEERRAAATRLAELYRCSLAVCGPGETQILFTQQAT